MSKSKSKTILLVEDEAIIALSHKKKLNKYGFDVVTADTGEKAVEIARSDALIDLVLMDINLGDGIDGTEAAEIILKIRNLPLVFLSSHTDQEVVDKTDGITSYGYIVKNSGETVLAASIKMAFRLFEANEKLKNATAALKESEEKFRQITESMGEVLWLRSKDNAEILYISPTYEKVWGQSCNSLYDNPSSFIDSVYDEDKPAVISEFKKYRSAGKFDLEYRIIRPDGSIRWIWAQSFSVRNDIGDIVRYAGIAQDITERKRIEFDLAENEERFRLLFEQAEFSFSLYDVILDNKGMLCDLAFLEVNEAYEKITGRNASDFYNKTLLQIFPATEEYWLKKCEEVILTGKPCHYENYSKELDRYIELFVYTPQKGKLAFIGLDSTDRKKSEEKLILSERTYREIFDNINDSLFIHDINTGDILDVNESMLNKYGYLREDLPGLTVESLSLLVEPYTNKHAIELIKRAANGETVIFEWLNRKKNGEVFYSENILKYVIIAGTPRIMAIVRDVTDRKKAEEKIRLLLTEKELLLKEVHHRIKNNMNTIKGLLTLQIYSEDDPKVVSSLQSAENRVYSMIMLYDRLYSTNNYRELSVKEYLEPLTSEIIGSFPVSANLTLETEIDNFILNVRLLSPLGIIVNELLTNIMKYAFTEQESGKIFLSAKIENNRVKFVIWDNGVGIPETVNFGSSTGFGLDLVKMLVDQIQGSIRIERNEGTRFVLEFED